MAVRFEKTQIEMLFRLYMKPRLLLFSSFTFLSCYLGSVEGGIRSRKLSVAANWLRV